MEELAPNDEHVWYAMLHADLLERTVLCEARREKQDVLRLKIAGR
jgi:hypothetical protein